MNRPVLKTIVFETLLKAAAGLREAGNKNLAAYVEATAANMQILNRGERVTFINPETKRRCKGIVVAECLCDKWLICPGDELPTKKGAYGFMVSGERGQIEKRT